MAIISTSPSSLATNVVRNIAFRATFDVDLDRNSVTSLTVLLVKSSDNTPVSGVVDYIPGTRSVTFQMSELLESNTQYSWILVGRKQGIRTMALEAALPANYQVTFTTGTSLDYSLPLASSTTTVSDISAFQGGQGVYDVVFGQTGEPLSHVVTTAGQIGPSGNIIPAPFASSVYLAVSGSLDPDPIEIVSTDPENGDAFLNADNLDAITVVFSEDPSNSGLVDGGVSVLVEDLLDLTIDQPTWTTQFVDRRVVTTPDEWIPGAKYTVTVSSEISTGSEATELGEDYIFSFTTKPEKYFTTVKMVRINLGAAAAKVTDEEIQLLIYENSLWAFENHGPLTGGQTGSGFDVDDPPIYVKEYVLCKTKLDVMNTILMGTDAPTAEKIGDVEFRYGAKLTDRFKSKMEELEDCVKDNEELILNGGVSGSMRVAVRGLGAPGRPIRTDTWRRLNDDGTFPTKDRRGAI